MLYCHAFFSAFRFSNLGIVFKPIHVHGLLTRSVRASSRILFAGRGHGDVTFTEPTLFHAGCGIITYI